MKIQKLTIHNIASIEDAVIDFEAQPLADSEVFLITGKTGAGKSTILDAICLALYADTPRLDGTKMQGDTKDGEKTVKIDDPRQLMRRNTGEAFVSLTFTGSNGIHYEATWSVVRAGKKATGNIQPKDWQLKNLDTNVTFNKDKEIKTEILVAIGLDFNQFCRTTILAQGEFTRFLDSKDEEKAEILEKITGVDIYSKIGAKVFAVTGKKEQIWLDAKRQVEGMQILSDEEIEDKQKALGALDKEYKEVKDKSDKDTAKRNWLKTEGDLIKNISDANNELLEANKAVESPQFKTKESLVNEWNATIKARNWMAEVQKAESDQKKQNNELTNLQDDFTSLLGGLKYAEKEIEKTESEIEDIDNFITKESDKAGVYENAQTIIGSLNVIEDGHDFIEKNKEKIAEEKKSLDGVMIPAYEKANSEFKSAKEAFDKEDADVKDHEEAVNALNLNKLRTERDAVKDLLGKIETAIEAKSQYEKNRQSLSDQKSTIDKKTEESKNMEAPIHDSQIEMDVRKKCLDKQKDTIDKFASAMRLKLHVGDTCPVCRQKIETEIPHEEKLSALVDGLQNEYNEAEKAHKKLVDAKVKLDAEIKAETKAYEKAKIAFDEDKSVYNAEQKAKEACKVCGIGTLDVTTTSALTGLEKSTTNRYKILDDKIKEGESQEEETKEMRKTLEGKRTNLETLSKNVHDAEEAVKDCKGRIQTAEALVLSKKEEVKKAHDEVSELITSGIWEIDWETSPKEFALSLSSATEAYNTSTQNKQRLEKNLGTAKTNCNNVATVVKTILDAMPSWKTIESKAVKTTDLLNKINGISKKVTVALTQLQNAENSLNLNFLIYV